MSNVQVYCFLLSYLVAFLLELLEWTRLLRRAVWKSALMWLITLAGFVAHTTYLLVRSRELNLPPLLSSTHDWMLVLAWVAVLFYLFLTLVDRNLAVGMFLLPVVLVLIAAACFVSDRTTVILGDVQKGWVMLHAALLVFGIGGVIIGLVLSVMYLVQHRRLKHKQSMQEGLTLPSLALLARLNWWAVMVAVPLLTLGMLTGVILGLQAKREASAFDFSDPVVIGNGVVWLAMFAFLIWLAVRPRAGGKQVAWLTVWAFGFLLVTLIGLQILAGRGLDSLHSKRPNRVPSGECRVVREEVRMEDRGWTMVGIPRARYHLPSSILHPLSPILHPPNRHSPLVTRHSTGRSAA